MKNLRDINCIGTDTGDEPSATVPNQSLTISEVVARFASGIPAEFVKEAYYDEDKIAESDEAFDDFDNSEFETREQGIGFEEAFAEADALKTKLTKSKKANIKKSQKDDNS